MNNNNNINNNDNNKKKPYSTIFPNKNDGLNN